MDDASKELVALVEYVVTPLVDEPEEVSVTHAEGEDGRILIEIRVSEGDVGKVIGRQGRVIKSIRTLARAAATRKDAQVEVELVD
ncbi:MAG: KH domain-containing protein [Eggerthellaceae bacterium]|nr:KH domain-containing protein [Eggerthellaceae bacterium]